ncbi:MAG TPA: hypothetical protein VJ464_28505 [Blastocatellia bacterium]|nr:hypothetical protein [Blastocatellia bacterium]
MSNTNIIIPADLTPLISERERVLQAADHSAKYVAELNQLSSQVADCPPAALQSTFSQAHTPPDQLASVLPLLKNELDNINRLRADIAGRQMEIEQIKKRDKVIVMVGVVAVILLVIILIAKLSS